MYSYVYSVDAVDSTLTSTGTFYSTSIALTTYGIPSATYTIVSGSTLTTSSVETYTSGETYIITDYTSATTETCDYSATTSQQTYLLIDSNTSGSTYTYKTINHSTGGTHTVSESTKIATLSSSSVTSYTEYCGYSYFDTQSTSNSITFGTTRTKYTGSTIYHTPYGTHTVSSSTKEIVLAYDYLITYTQNCDFSKTTSIQTTSGSSNFGGYSQSTYISTHYGQYGTRTISSRTVEIASSNASQTKSVFYYTDSTSAYTITDYYSTTRTLIQSTSQTSLNTANNIGSNSSATNDGGITSFSIQSAYVDEVDYTGLTASLVVINGSVTSYLTDTAFFHTKISSTFQEVYSAFGFTNISNFVEYNQSYLQPEVEKTSYSSHHSIFSKKFIYYTGAYYDILQSIKIYTTDSYEESYTFYASYTQSTQTTTSYSSTRQTSSIAYNSASITTTKASTIFEAAKTSRTVSLTQTVTTQSSSGTSTISSTLTYAGFSTTITVVTQTQGTIPTSYSTFIITKKIDWFTAYARDNGEILMVIANSTASALPLSEAGFTTTAWSNETAVKETLTSQTASSGIYYTYAIGSTYTSTKGFKYATTSINAFSVSPWISSNYNSIENAYGFSLIGSSSSSYNPDLSVFSMSEYQDTASTVTQSVTLNRGPYLITYNSINGSTSATSTSVSFLTFTESGYGRKIKPMSFVTFAPFSDLPRVINFTTSNTVLKI